MMKRTFFLLLFVIAFTCASKAIPISFKGNDYEIFEHSYIGVILMDDGTIVNVEGTNQTGIDWKSNSIQGPILGTGNIPVTASSDGQSIAFYSKNLEFSFDDQNGMISPAGIFRNNEGKFEIKPHFVISSIHSEYPVLWLQNEYNGESYSLKIYSQPENDLEYYGIAVFVKDADNNWKALNNYIELSSEYISIGEYIYSPPENIEIKGYQCISLQPQGVMESYRFSQNFQGQYLNFVKCGENIYISGFYDASGLVDGWLYGEINENTVTFKRGQSYGLTGLKLATFEVSYNKNSKNVVLTLTPSEQDLTFEYNDLLKKLSSANLAFSFVENINAEIQVNAPFFDKNNLLTPNSWKNIYVDCVISPSERGILTPSTPSALKFENDSNIVPLPDLTCLVTNVSTSGDVLDQSKLYYRVIFKDKILDESPFETDYFYPNLLHTSEYTDNDQDYYGIQLVYYVDREEKTSNIAGYSSVTQIKNDEVINRDTPLYDLQGRIVNKENINPGIYIQDGRKIQIQ